jgi:hypothetical protein
MEQNKEITPAGSAPVEQKDSNPAKEQVDAFVRGGNTLPDFKNLDPTLRKQVALEFVRNPEAVAKLKQIKADIDKQSDNYYKEYNDIKEDIKLGSDIETLNNLSVVAHSALGFAGMGPWKRMEDAREKWENSTKKSENLLVEVF